MGIGSRVLGFLETLTDPSSITTKVIGALVSAAMIVSLLTLIYNGIYDKGFQACVSGQQKAQIENTAKIGGLYENVDKITPFAGDKSDVGKFLLEHTSGSSK